MCVSEISANGEGVLRLVFCCVGVMLRRMHMINRGLDHSALSGSACWAMVGELCVMVMGAGWEGEWNGVSVVQITQTMRGWRGRALGGCASFGLARSDGRRCDITFVFISPWVLLCNDDVYSFSFVFVGFSIDV